MSLERLELRQMLNVDWRNPLDNLDVTADGIITASDALQVINFLNSSRERLLPAVKDPTLGFVDTTGDGRVSPSDALRVINRLNAGSGILRNLVDGQSFAVQDDIDITLGQSSGTRIYRMEIGAGLSPTESALLADSFSVFIVDPQNESQTLLDNGVNNSPIFSLSSSGVDLATGVARWDGRILEVDLGSIQDRDTAKLKFQLINGNSRFISSVQLKPLSNQVVPDVQPGSWFDLEPAKTNWGPAIGLSQLTATTQITARLGYTGYDRGTGSFEAELSLMNQGDLTANNVVVIIAGLPAGVTVVDPSGVDGLGRPFLNVKPAMVGSGLVKNQKTTPIRFSISNPDNQSLDLSTEILVSENRAPLLNQVSTQNVIPGDTLTLPLIASDPDGDSLTFRVQSASNLPLPNVTINSRSGELEIAPTPDHIGQYQVSVSVSDKYQDTARTFTLNVQPDSIGTTRVSGRILDADQTPLEGMAVEIGGVRVLTGIDGTFLLDLGVGPIATDTIKVRGEQYVRPNAVYPFIAEKLPFMLGRPLYHGFKNVLSRPIFLPKLNSGTPINPAVDSTVTAELRPGQSPVEVDVKAGSLFTQGGLPFNGSLSITEVPVGFTPAALPANLIPDLLVTIQPGEMVFATPAPLQFPNTANHPPGTILDLWSINPVTGEFDDVGDMRVTQDGKSIETIFGGIRNSSWHFPALPAANPGQLAPASNNSNPDPKGRTPCSGGAGSHTPQTTNAGVAMSSEACLYSGALKEFHTTATYNSLGQDRGIELAYSSLRAHATPIIHFGISNVNVGEGQRLGGRVTVTGNGASLQLGDATNSLLWRVPASPVNGPQVDVTMAVQADMSTLPSGLYDYSVMYGPGQWIADNFSGTLFQANAQLLHVNSKDSPYGAGWGINGLQQLIENDDGSILLIDGGLFELLFSRNTVDANSYDSPKADFSKLIRSGSGWQRRLPDGTIYSFRASDGRLTEVADRVGNRTVYAYNGDGSLASITDPVGLVTSLEYFSSRLKRIVDPAGRVTTFEHDSDGNLIKVTDPDDATRTWSYDDRNLMTGEIDARGNRESSYYDEFGRIAGATRKDGSQWQVRPVSVVGLHPLERLTDAENPPTAALADETNAILIDGRGEATTFWSDRTGQATRTQDRVGRSGSFDKDSNDLIREVKDSRGYSTIYKYDDHGNVTFIQDEINQPANIFADPFTRSGFNPNGQFGPETWTSTSIAQADFNRDGFGDILIGNEFARATIHYGNEAGKFPESQLLREPANANDVLSSGSFSYAVDLNSDGWTDVLHVSHGFVAKLNNGDGTWRDSAVSGITPDANFTPQTAVFADFNEDGKIDLVRTIAPTMVEGELHPRSTYKVFLGQGDGTFSPGQTLLGSFETSFNQYYQIDLADLNQDGHADVIVAAMGEGPSGERWPLGKLLVFPGLGDGTFSTATEIPTGIETGSPNSLRFRVVDIDGDNDLDFLFADDWLLSNRGDGSYETKDISNGRSRIVALNASDTVLDLDNDGDLDIVRHATAFVSGTVSLQTLINDGNENFDLVLNKAHSSGSTYSRSAIVTDTNSNGIYEAQVLGNNGFSTARLEPAPSEASALDLGFQSIDKIYTGDFNLDGFDDLAIYGTDQSLRTGIWLLESKPQGGFEDPRNIYLGSTWKAEFLDVNQDRRLDLLVANAYTNEQNQYIQQISIFTRQVSGEYVKSTDLVIDAIGSVFYSTGDVDGDDDTDIVVSRQGENSLLYRNLGSHFSAEFDLGFSTSGSPFLMDINNDGLDDLYYGFSPGWRVGIRYASLERIFSDEIETGLWRTGGATAGDIDGDGAVDIVTFQSTGFLGPPTSYGRFLNRGNGFQALDLLDAWRVNSYEPQLKDIDNDGDLDILGYQRGSSTLNIYRNDGSGEYSEPVSFTVGTNTDQILGERVVFTDIDRDGYDDLVYVEQNRYGQIQVRFNQLTNQGKHFEYETNFNQVTKYTDDLGRVTVNQIDPNNGNLLSVTEVVGGLGGADDRVTTYTYTSRGQVASMTDSAGVVTKYDYNTLGRLISMTQAFGSPDAATTSYAYDTAGNLSQSTDPLGRVTLYKYDRANRLIETVQPDPDGTGPLTSPVWKVEYDKNGNLTKLVDPLNRTTDYTYDSLNRIVTVRNALLQSSQIRYDSASNVVATVDELGRQTTFAYDTRNRLVTETDALGKATRYAYSADDQLTSVIDPLGRKTSLVYDARGRQTAKIDPFGKRFTTIFDAADQVIETIDELGRSTKFSYSRFDELTQQIDALGGTSQAEYDSVGNPIRLVDATGKQTLMAYDDLNRLTLITNAMGGQKSVAYDLVGNIVRTEDELRRASTFEYDALDRRIRATDALNGLWSFQFDAVGNVVSSTDARNNTTTVSYDALDRLVVKTSPDNATEKWFYDARGNLTAHEDGESRRSTYVYDALDRLIESRNPLQQLTSYSYDAVGNLLTTTDGLRKITRREYDRLDRVVKLVDPRNGETSFEYDAVGNRTSLTDPVQNKTTFAYDSLNRLTRETNILGKALVWKYDAVGNVTEAIDRNGRVRAFQRDDLHRITRERWLDGSGNTVREMNWSYDAASQLLSASDPDSQWSFTYDALGRVASGDNQGTPVSPRVQFTYGYDANGNQTSRADRIAGTQVGSIARTFDNRDRVASIQQNSGGLVNRRVDFEYDKSGLFKSLTRYRDASGQQQVAKTNYQYDAAARIQQIKHASIDQVLATYDYSWDAADRITRIASPDGVANYTYDATDQLVGADHSAQQDESYVYDLNGNRTLPGYQTGQNNRLLSDGRFNYSYDDNGNRILRAEINTGQRTEYTWDYRNRLTSVIVKSSSGVLQSEVRYTYDVFDRRIRKSIDGDGVGPGTATIKQYAHDGDHVAFEFDGAGNVTHRYLHGPVIDMVLANETGSGVVHWMLTDHLGTIRDIIDSSGGIINHIQYDSFGQIIAQSNAAFTPTFAYTGREWDPETGLFQHRARSYDPSTGIFVSEDPIRFDAGDSNLFRYVFNMTMVLADPTGLVGVCVGASGNVVAGVVGNAGFGGCLTWDPATGRWEAGGYFNVGGGGGAGLETGASAQGGFSHNATKLDDLRGFNACIGASGGLLGKVGIEYCRSLNDDLSIGKTDLVNVTVGAGGGAEGHGTINHTTIHGGVVHPGSSKDRVVPIRRPIRGRLPASPPNKPTQTASTRAKPQSTSSKGKPVAKPNSQSASPNRTISPSNSSCNSQTTPIAHPFDTPSKKLNRDDVNAVMSELGMNPANSDWRYENGEVIQGLTIGLLSLEVRTRAHF